jgi:hypothetical protein
MYLQNAQHFRDGSVNMVKDQIRKVENLVQTEKAVTKELRNPDRHISQPRIAVIMTAEHLVTVPLFHVISIMAPRLLN